MYGTIAHLRAKPGRGEELQALQSAYDDVGIPGMVATYVYRMDANPDEYMLAVVFKDRDTYRRNAEDPAQDVRYRQMMELLAGPPEWHDGEIVWTSAAR
jgi:quinol monooxygenase YgiN